MEEGRVPVIRGFSVISKDIKFGQFVKEGRSNSAPVKLFSQRRRYCKYCKLPKLGMEPVNEFRLNSNKVSMEALLIEVGIFPLSLL